MGSGSLVVGIVGEIAKMVEPGIEPNKKQAKLGERTACSVKLVAGACNHRELTLRPINI